MKKIVYLYSEIMPYAISVMRALVEEFNVEVECISWDQNKRTPFVPENEKGITFHKRSAFDKQSIIAFLKRIDPFIMYVSGRMDALYLEGIMDMKSWSKCKIVTGSDNQWEGTNKQKLAAIMSHRLYGKYFDYFWVPGRRQYEFARRMGYPNERIISNLLTADSRVFAGAYEKNRTHKQQRVPHNLVYAGRFAKTKGIDILIDAFLAARKELNNDWQLTLVGSGDEISANEPFINIKGFMSGAELAENSKDWTAYCLPSVKEPWGVVVHEFAMLGLPVICSTNVGAADDMVVNNYNGFIFESGNKESLKQAIIRLMSATDKELLLMGERGHELSKKQSPLIAAYSLMSIV
ncbi:glycosyltransferase [Flavipsychrobacter stenotrophus]|uniref:glycosyltransferase n=1 Tax=Flavipsychrobacter stenotrophus TaxID=2077091 RepID=UPI00105756B4|nr:glycosyltransferase [Flavipsychrobacter stenotrophus]